jgi:hypothetical protein
VTGLERTVEAVTEEAIVRAVESPAVERALARVLRGPVVEEAMQDAMNSAAVERALTDALDSELVDNVWRRLLASDEAQQLVERIAEAPELRSAIAAQSVGFLDDIRRQVRKAARRLDDVVERIARRLFRRPRRVAPPEFAGLITRGLAVAVDIGILNVFFLAISALIAIVASLFVSGNVAAPAVAAGLATWVIAGGIYAVAFWALASQTPGMRLPPPARHGARRHSGVPGLPGRHPLGTSPRPQRPHRAHRRPVHAVRTRSAVGGGGGRDLRHRRNGPIS